jgi:Ricin-type beta-trefoil lectin domain-like
LLRAKHSNKYLGVLDGRLDPTAPIVQQDLYLDDARQIWTSQFIVQGSFLTHTINVHSGLVLDVFDNRTDNETPIIQFPVKQPVTFNQSFLWISVGFEN